MLENYFTSNPNKLNILILSRKQIWMQPNTISSQFVFSHKSCL